MAGPHPEPHFAAWREGAGSKWQPGRERLRAGDAHGEGEADGRALRHRQGVGPGGRDHAQRQHRQDLQQVRVRSRGREAAGLQPLPVRRLLQPAESAQ